jgi:hypothetical protein
MTSAPVLDSAPAFVAVQLDERVDRRRAPIGARLVELSRRYATAAPEWAAVEETVAFSAR